MNKYSKWKAKYSHVPRLIIESFCMIKDNIKSVMSYLAKQILKFESICTLLSLIGIAFNIWVFYPGYMSYDSLEYLKQAIGVAPYDSLHPVFMSLLWGVLSNITGHTSSLLVFMVTGQWLGFLLISLYIYKTTKNKILSIITLLAPLLPYVFNISGVMWSDVLFANILIVSLGMILWMRCISKRIFLILMMIIIMIALMYAMVLRYNSLPAVVPMIFMTLYGVKITKNKWIIGGATAIITISAVVVLVLSPRIVPVKDLKIANSIMLSDIVNVSSNDLIKKYATSINGADYIQKVFDCAHERQLFLDVMPCKVATGNVFESAAPYTDDIKSVWYNSVLSNKLNYIELRLYNIATFLFPAYQNRYIWHDGINANEMNIAVRNPKAGQIVYTVINNFYYKYMPFLFEPWFWLLLALSVFYGSIKFMKTDESIIYASLSMSSALLILSYFPTGATVDYRYIYWSTMAISVSIIMLLTKLDYNSIRKAIVKNINAIYLK